MRRDGWTDGVTGVLESQAEANRAMTKAMESYVKVVDEAMKSQERTNRALAESMESYRETIEKFSELQEKNTELTRGFFEGVTGELREGAQSSQAMTRDLTEGSRKQMEAFQQMIGEAAESYTDLMNTPYELYRKNLEAMKKMASDRKLGGGDERARREREDPRGQEPRRGCVGGTQRPGDRTCI